MSTTRPSPLDTEDIKELPDSSKICLWALQYAFHSKAPEGQEMGRSLIVMNYVCYVCIQHMAHAQHHHSQLFALAMLVAQVYASCLTH